MRGRGGGRSFASLDAEDHLFGAAVLDVAEWMDRGYGEGSSAAKTSGEGTEHV